MVNPKKIKFGKVTKSKPDFTDGEIKNIFLEQFVDKLQKKYLIFLDY